MYNRHGSRTCPISLPDLPLPCCPNSSDYYNGHLLTRLSYSEASSISILGSLVNRTSRISVVIRESVSQFIRSEAEESHSCPLLPWTVMETWNFSFQETGGQKRPRMQCQPKAEGHWYSSVCLKAEESDMWCLHASATITAKYIHIYFFLSQ